ncbi:hypothetical protein ZWY2020_052147 [Hordeum vulgare]|nr:hypothetical protein ZWY2020_052147 [Hordeum vulgare]
MVQEQVHPPHSYDVHGATAAARPRIPGRTYKFYDGPEVLYWFGHGLSYTKFRYESSAGNGTAVTLAAAGGHCKRLSYKAGAVDAAPSCPAIDAATHACKETVDFNVSVVNAGDVDGSHVVLVYTVPPPEVAGAPIKQVVAFQRVFVKAGGAATVGFTLKVCEAFGIVEKTAYTVVPSGTSTVLLENGDTSSPSSVSFPVKINFYLD